MATAFNLYPLHVFRVVAQAKSVSAAARILFVSQPAVSAHLKSLEASLGAPLFDRTPQGMHLTATGAALLDHVRPLLALYQEIPTVVGAVRGRVSGEVVVAASSTPGTYLVPKLLRDFQDMHAQARPTLRVGDSAQVVQWLREYQAPLGIVGQSGIGDDLQTVRLDSDVLQLVAAMSDPLSRRRSLRPPHVHGRTLLVREQGSSTRAGAEALLGPMLHEFDRIVEIPSTEAIKQSVAAGLGIAVLSSWATRLEESVGLLRPIRDPAFRQERAFFLLKRKDRRLIGVSGALWNHLAGMRRR